MSLKAIEMQVALPRTVEASSIQQQLNQRSQLANDTAAIELQKQTEWQQHSILKNEASQKTDLKKDGESQQNLYHKKNSKPKKKIDEKNHSHPTKGNSIDFLG